MVGFFEEADSTATKDSAPMDIQYFDGTITFGPGERLAKNWEHELSVNFSEGVGASLPVFGLYRLQMRCRGELDVERACKQAHDLRRLIERTLGLHVNIAHAAHP
jgi:hypothetical protein